MPAAVYIAKTTEHPEEAKRFVAFIASTKGCDVAAPPTAPPART